MNIFVAKLNSATDDASLRELFEEFGTVDSAKVIMDKFTGDSRGFGFVEMPDESEANTAIEELDDTKFEGNFIVVKKARPREDNRGGGNRRDGGGYNKRNFKRDRDY